MPELQAASDRVELQDQTKADFVRILTDRKLFTRQYEAPLQTGGSSWPSSLTPSGAADYAYWVNQTRRTSAVAVSQSWNACSKSSV